MAAAADAVCVVDFAAAGALLVPAGAALETCLAPMREVEPLASGALAAFVVAGAAAALLRSGGAILPGLADALADVPVVDKVLTSLGLAAAEVDVAAAGTIVEALGSVKPACRSI